MGFDILNYGRHLPILGSYVEYWLPSQKASHIAKKTLNKVPDEVIPYEDRSPDGTILSSTKVGRYTPETFSKNYKCHKDLRSLSEYIAHQRNPSSKTISKEASRASFSAKNRGDLKTEVTLSSQLKSVLGLEGRSDEEITSLLEIESLYKHNSECNGHSYLDEKGKFVHLHSAIESSADRKAKHVQNLSVVKTAGSNLLYTGRPDTLHKAKEQVLFILSHKKGTPSLEEVEGSTAARTTPPKWLEQVKGLKWNAEAECIEFSYAVYSLMSDSSMMSHFYGLLNSPEDNERKFIQEEKTVLEKVKKESMLIKDSEGNVFKLQAKPILLSQGFNAFSTLKAFVSEGGISSVLMDKAYQELRDLLKPYPEKLEKLTPHLEALDLYFSGKNPLSSLHLFMHMNLIISEISGEDEELPLVLHCKSSTDRTGIGAAILTSIRQMKNLGMEIPSDMEQLTQDVRFKELFALNWIPTWHQRSEYSRDIPGISFGAGISQNPVIIECLPQRYLTRSSSSLRYVASGAFAALSVGILGALLSLNTVKNMLLFRSKKPEDLALFSYKKNELFTLSYLPHISVNPKGLQYKSGKAALSPLQKIEKKEKPSPVKKNKIHPFSFKRSDYSLEKIPGDGDCCFRSVAHGLIDLCQKDKDFFTQLKKNPALKTFTHHLDQGRINSDLLVRMLRNMAAEYAEKHHRDFLTDEERKTYAKEIQGKMWGGNHELASFSEIFGINFFLNSTERDDLSRQIGEKSGPTISLEYTGNHYNLLQSKL